MKVFLWRHNKTYHSHSMIDEPCVNSEFYLDALAIVAARDKEEALALLAEEGKGWRVEDLRALPCQELDLEQACIIFSELRGSISHL